MSYILDALRRAEHERMRGRVPSLATGELEPAAERRPWRWVGGGALAVLIALAAWLWIPGLLATAPPPAPPPAVAPTTPATPPQPPVARQAAPRAKADTNPAPPAAREVPARTKVTPAPERRQTAHAAPESGRLVEPVENLAPVRPKAEAEDAQPAGESTAAAPVEAAPPPPPPTPRPVETVRVSPPPAAPPAPSAPALPPLHEVVGKMTLNVLVYSEVKTDRMVFIDGQQYVEGQKVRGQYLVERITPEGAVLSANGERVLLPAPFRRP